MSTREIAAVNGYEPVLYGGDSSGSGLVVNPPFPIEGPGLPLFSPVILSDPILKAAPAPTAAPPVAAPSPRVAMQPKYQEAAPAGGAAPAAAPADAAPARTVGSLVLLALVLALFAIFAARGER